MSAARPRPPAALVLLRGDGTDDAALARRLRDGAPGAAAELFERLGAHVNRVLLRVLGGGPDHDDRVQEVFLEVLRSVRSLRDDAALRPWVTTIAVRVARAEIRRRRLRRIFLLAPDETIPEIPTDLDAAARDALRALWGILEAMPTEERLAFALRFVHGDELTDVAAACGCSLATIKRRLARAEARFLAAARRHPELAARIARGERWNLP